MDGVSRPDPASEQDTDHRCTGRRLRVSGLSVREGQTLPSSQEDEAQGHNPSEDQADIWKMPSGHYSIVEPDAAWLVWILQAQLQDDVFRAGRLDSDEAAKHPPETQRSQRTWSRFRSSSLAEFLLCRSRAV